MPLHQPFPEAVGTWDCTKTVHDSMTLLTLRRALETAQAKNPHYTGGLLLGGIALGSLPEWDMNGYANPQETPPGAQEFLRGVSWPEESRGTCLELKTCRVSKVFEGARLAVELALGQKASSAPPRCEGLQFFLQSSCTWQFQTLLNTRDVPRRAAGILLHLIQDSFCHGPFSPPPGTTLRQKMEHTLGALPAIETGARLLQMLDMSSHTSAIMRFLEQNVFALASSLPPALPPAERFQQAARPLP
ncbi:hypothetical protein SAMN05444354_105207 [Stigmatella aurantiaca]|uniref:Uncharacterized protein n=1 Tax=Stigmatella aurantiaca TaxID=41 RepID=A0A1H7P872_STIAU|nr:hypothetical protein [Stigmatella aurantiaca]SEL31953.1 hypothetical protein SAMN05444354_105207 [Stigmatella aurantiaca]